MIDERSARAGTTTRVAVVIPVLNEATAIGDVIRGLRAVEAVCCVLVVDGGSLDDTPSIAANAGARVIHEPRRGYGRACRTGTEVALTVDPDPSHEHDAVAFLDGDGACDPVDLDALVRATAGHDVVLGVRPKHRLERDAMPWHAQLGNALVAGMASVLTGRRVHDLPPLKVVRGEALRRLAVDDDGYGWTAQLVTRALADRGLRIAEHETSFRVRRGGESKVSGSWRTSIAAGRAMIGTVRRERRPRPLLALMAKGPQAGQAKTRLARDIGGDATVAFWVACLADAASGVRGAATAGRAAMVTLVPADKDVEPVRSVIGASEDIRVQTSVGLAGALVDVFLEAWDRGADRAVAVAGDSPMLGPEPILDALAALDGAREAAVLGPTPDGGYHLVGLRWGRPGRWLGSRRRLSARLGLERRLRLAFAPAAMGTASALEATRTGLDAAGWRVQVGQPWPDIDTGEDLRALARTRHAWAASAPRTADWMDRHPEIVAPPPKPAPEGAAVAAPPMRTGTATAMSGPLCVDTVGPRPVDEV